MLYVFEKYSQKYKIHYIYIYIYIYPLSRNVTVAILLNRFTVARTFATNFSGLILQQGRKPISRVRAAPAITPIDRMKNKHSCRPANCIRRCKEPTSRDRQPNLHRDIDKDTRVLRSCSHAIHSASSTIFYRDNRAPASSRP
jgi:hypothetical protein